MSRFIFPGKYAMRVNQGGGTVLAYFTVVDPELGLEFSDVRLIEGKNGVFVGAPYREYVNKDGEKKYADFWRAAYNEDEGARNENGVAYLEEMAQAAYAKYQEVSSNSPAPRKAAAKGKAAAKPSARRGGRGPVAPTVDADDDDDDLPF